MKYMVDRMRVDELINEYDLTSKSRKQDYIWNRSAVYNFLHLCNYSLTEIGRMLDKNHATVIHGLKLYDNNLMYSDFKYFIKPIEDALQECIVVEFKTYNDTCVNEAICMVNLENLISEKL